MIKFEGQDRREAKLKKLLPEFGFQSLEEANELCLSKGINVSEIVKGIQPICFENAVWAYTVGAAIAIKSGCKKASDAAAAIGIGIDVEAPEGNMIVDIGGGTTEIAVISLGGIVSNKSIKVAGDDLNADIIEYMGRMHNIRIDEPTAERIKIVLLEIAIKIFTHCRIVCPQMGNRLIRDHVHIGNCDTANCQFEAQQHSSPRNHHEFKSLHCRWCQIFRTVGKEHSA